MAKVVLKHAIVQGLADLVTGQLDLKSMNPIMRATLRGLFDVIPHFLMELDNNEEAIAQLRAQLQDILAKDAAEQASVVEAPVEAKGDSSNTKQ